MPSEETTPVPIEDQPVNTRAAVELALRAGLPPTYVARQLNVSVEGVKAVRTFRSDTTVLSTGDTELDDRLHELTWLCVNQAFFEVLDPTSPHRIPLIKILVGRAAANVGTRGRSQEDALREMFMENMEGIRETALGDEDSYEDEDDIPEVVDA